MGIYDSQINSLRRKIDEKNNEIDTLKRDLQELEVLLTKCEDVNFKVSETVNSIFQDIYRKSGDIKGNFISYYKSNIDQIFRNNGVYNISGETIDDKNRIKNNIINFEERIQNLHNEIHSLEQDLSYYLANNVEAEVKAN